MTERAAAGLVAWTRADRRRLDVAIAAATVAFASLLISVSPEDFDSGWPEVLAGVGAFVMLVFRRRAPVAFLALALAWTALHVGLWQRPTPMIFSILVLLITVCVRLERWPALVLGASIALSLYVAAIVGNNVEFGDARAVIGIAWTAGAVGAADAIRSWSRYRQSADAQIRSAVLAAEVEARHRVSQERLTIARELHDLLAHNLSVMNVQTGAALHLLHRDPDQAQTSLEQARDAGRNVLDELRELLAVLRSDEGDDAPTASLPTFDDLDRLVDSMRSAGLEVTWHRTGRPQALAPAVSLAAYRIVQEALTNAAKHGTGTADLHTTWDDVALRLEIANTTGPEPAGHRPGIGLVGMRERAAVNGGRLDARGVGDRFVVEAWLPASVGSETTG